MTWTHSSAVFEPPRSVIWNVEYDHRLGRALFLKVNHLERDGSHEFIVDPTTTAEGPVPGRRPVVPLRPAEHETACAQCPLGSHAFGRPALGEGERARVEARAATASTGELRRSVA